MAPVSSFKKYIKSKGPDTDSKVTSVNIRGDQHKFIERHGLNLSMIVRDAIDELMKQRNSK